MSSFTSVNSRELNNDPRTLIELLVEEKNNNSERGWKAFERLVQLEAIALPVLISHLDDDRTANLQSWSVAMNTNNPNKYEGVNVGYVCREIIAEILGFKSSKHAAASPAWPFDLKLWYSQRDNWSFNELKREVIACRIEKYLETGSENNNNDETLKELKKELSKLSDITQKRDYAWEKPPSLDKVAVLEKAHSYILKTSNNWRDFTHKSADYDNLTDCWIIYLSNPNSIDESRFKRLLLSIDDESHEVRQIGQ